MRNNFYNQVCRYYAEVDHISVDSVKDNVLYYSNSRNRLTTLWENSHEEDMEYFKDKEYKYLDLMAFNNLSKGSVDHLKRWDISPMKVMDFGCGNGVPANYLASVFPESKVVGFDPDEGVINFASNLSKNLNILNTSFSTKRPEGEYDLVVCLEVLEHFKEPLKFIENILLPYSSKYLLITCNFTQMWPGHHSQYVIDEKLTRTHIFSTIKNRISDKFIATNTGWNGHPTLFKKI